MKAAVRYFTRSGNTKKLAEVIANAVGTISDDVSTGLTEKTDVLFLGSSLYAGSYDPAVGEFIEKNADKIGKIVVFSTSASGKSTYKKIGELARKKGIEVFEEHFVCPGHFLFLHKNRPDRKDMENAAEFAKKL